MHELFSTGLIVDLIIVFVLAEWAAIVLFRVRSGKGIPALEITANLLAGILLMLALRAALVGASWHWIAAALTAALAAHLGDLSQRWRGSREPPRIGP